MYSSQGLLAYLSNSQRVQEHGPEGSSGSALGSGNAAFHDNTQDNDLYA
jgi:hypothetical protein